MMKIILTILLTLLGIHTLRRFTGGSTLVLNMENQQLIFFKAGSEQFFIAGKMSIEDYHSQLEELWSLCDDVVQKKMLGIEDEDIDFEDY